MRCKAYNIPFFKINNVFYNDSSSSSSVGTTTLVGIWSTLRFRSTIFYLYTSLSIFSLFSRFSRPFYALVVLFYIYRNYSLEPSQQCRFFQCAVASRTPNPLLRRTGVSLLVWVITFDLSGNGGPTSSYATVGIALRVI